MLVIVFFGLAMAVLAGVLIFVLTFIDVTSAGPNKRTNAPSRRQAELETELDHARSTNPAHHTSLAVSDARVVSPLKALPPVQHSEARITAGSLLYSRDTRHLRLLALLIAVGATGAFFLRSLMMPESFGARGPYRAAALEQIASQPSVLQSDASCVTCHTEVQEERAESPHQAVLCLHCHGNGREHILAATNAAESPENMIPAAQEWDGDFHTQIDLFVTQDRATCLSCHTSVVGMPDRFRSINVAMHLEEQGAEEINGKNVCFECHTGHSPGS